MKCVMRLNYFFLIVCYTIVHNVAAQVERPAVPFIQYNICPFECCQYGEWISKSSLKLYQTEGDTTNTALLINPNEEFTAIRGNVHIIKLGVVVVNATFEEFKKNDTLYILSSKGEGYYDVWYNGKIIQDIYEFWSTYETPLIENSITEWWILVKTQTGKYGWLRRTADSSEEIDGQDGCG